jgi:nitrogen fixation/metabolism regulation signal transduction histidine kinase
MDDIKKRIDSILEALQHVAAGNMDVSAPVSDKADELDALATGINMMLEEIKRRTEELKDKNRELETFNKIAIGRELKMIELKKKIDKMEKLLKEHGIDMKS